MYPVQVPGADMISRQKSMNSNKLPSLKTVGDPENEADLTLRVVSSSVHDGSSRNTKAASAARLLRPGIRVHFRPFPVPGSSEA